MGVMICGYNQNKDKGVKKIPNKSCGQQGWKLGGHNTYHGQVHTQCMESHSPDHQGQQDCVEEKNTNAY